MSRFSPVTYVEDLVATVDMRAFNHNLLTQLTELRVSLSEDYDALHELWNRKIFPDHHGDGRPGAVVARPSTVAVLAIIDELVALRKRRMNCKEYYLRYVYYSPLACPSTGDVG